MNEIADKQAGLPPKPPKRYKPRGTFLRDLFRKKPLGAAGMVILILLALVAIFADLLAPYPMVNGAMQVDVINKLQEPYLFMLSLIHISEPTRP